MLLKQASNNVKIFWSGFVSAQQLFLSIDKNYLTNRVISINYQLGFVKIKVPLVEPANRHSECLNIAS
jgi:hypothetical protein